MSLNKDLRAKYIAKIKSMRGVITAGTTGEVSYKLLQNYWLSGVRPYLEGQSSDDGMYMNVYDKEFLFAGQDYPTTPTEAGIQGVLGLSWQQIMPDGVPLELFGDNMAVQTDKQDQGKEEAGYWAHLKTGMYLVINYTSTGSVDVKFRANIYCHKQKVE